MNRPLTIAVTAYIASIVAANIVTAHLGLVPVGFGLMVTAGTYFAGFALLARDFVHRYGGVWWALASVCAGALLSLVLSTPELAVASAVAFGAAELLDLAVFTPLRRRGFIRAAFTSNLIAAPVDTILFLTLAGFGVTAELLIGQVIGKVLWATFVPLAIYAIATRHDSAVTA